MNETLQQEAESSHYGTDAPEPSQRDIEKSWDEGLKIIAQDNSPEAMDDYVAERTDRKDWKAGNQSVNDADRAQARAERHAKIARTEAATQAALEATSRQQRFAQEAQQYGLENVQDHIRHAEAMGRALAMDEMDERASPGLIERCNQIKDAYGPLAQHVSDLVRESPYRVQLLQEICDFPDENIAGLNGLSPIEAARRIAQAEMIFQQRGQQQAQPRRQSTAPAPVRTVRGGSGVQGKSPEDMNLDEYYSYRAKQIKARR